MKILGLGIVLIVVIAAVSANSGCSCGLGEGSNVCAALSGRGGKGGHGIRAQIPSRKASQWASESAIREAENQKKALAEQRAQAAARARLTGPTEAGCNGIAAIDGDTSYLSGLYKSGGEAQEDESVPGGGLSTQEILALGSATAIAPRFLPIGDPCFPGSSQGTSGASATQHAIVLPAKPGRPICSSCGGVQANDEDNSHDYEHDHDEASGDGGDEPDDDEADHHANDNYGAENHEQYIHEDENNSQSSNSQSNTLRVNRFRTNRLRGSNSRGRNAPSSSRVSRVRGSSSRSSHVRNPVHRHPSSRPQTSGCSCAHGARFQTNGISNVRDRGFSHGQVDYYNNRIPAGANYELGDRTRHQQFKSSSYGPAKSSSYEQVKSFSSEPAQSSSYEQVKSFSSEPAQSSSYGHVNSFNKRPVNSISYQQGTACSSGPLNKLISHARVRSHPLLSVLSQDNYAKTTPTFEDFDVDATAPALSFAEQERIYNGLGNRVPTVPADPVSVAIAYKKLIEPLQNLARGDGLAEGKEKSEAESSLYFGHKTTPADGREKAVENDVPEERLNTVDKPIVELKLNVPTFAGNQAVAAEQEGNSDTGSGAYISYRDLGYAPVAQSGNTFVTRPATSASVTTSLPSESTYEIGESLYKPLGKPLPGYEAGGVIFENNPDANDQATQAAMADALAEEEADDGYVSAEGDDLTSNCQQPGAISQSSGESSGQSSNIRTRLLSNTWARAAKSDCPFSS